MILPCICLSCHHVLLTYGNDRHSPGYAVACDCEAAREGRKAAGIYGLGWIFECKTCPHYKPASSEKTGEILTFDRDEIEEVAKGTRSFVIRSVCRPIDATFYAAGIQSRITESSPISLIDEGCSSLEELADSYLPQQYLIRFERV